MHTCYSLVRKKTLILLHVCEIKKKHSGSEDKSMRQNCWDEFTGLFPVCRLTEFITTLSIQEADRDPRSS